MFAATTNGMYPRKLRPKELDLIQFVLPDEHPGYKEYRKLVSSMVVLGEGRRGRGNVILGYKGDIPDKSSPLAPVIAYGMVETTADLFSITVREYAGKQIDVEIVSRSDSEIPDHFEEKRRWTYSTWRPGAPSPATQLAVREVIIQDDFVLAVASEEKRLWVHDGTTEINHLIPITNFYNELMLHKNIRDPKIALNSRLFFRDLDSYTDDDLRAAFIAYNKLKPKVEAQFQEPPVMEEGKFAFFFKKLFGAKP